MMKMASELPDAIRARESAAPETRRLSQVRQAGAAPDWREAPWTGRWL
jgi:hypothetical protein